MAKSQGYRKPHRIKKKKSILRSRYFWSGFLVLIISGAAFYLIYFSSVFQIKEIKISGNQKVSVQDVENIVKEKINQKLLFFQNRSIFLADSNLIVKTLSEKFPVIDTIKFERKLPATLIVGIQERAPVALWCKENDCFLIDKKGIIFEPALAEADFAKIRKGDETNNFLSLGEKAVEKNSIEKILKIQKTLSGEPGIKIQEFIVFAERLDVKTEEGWKIQLDLNNDIDWQLTELVAVLDKKIPPEKRQDLEYIDLRFSKVFYKYR